MEDKKVFNGEICWFNSRKGFGFISWEIDGIKQTDMFLHFSDLQMNGYKTVQANQKVSFEVGENKHGKAKAICVLILS